MFVNLDLLAGVFNFADYGGFGCVLRLLCCDLVAVCMLLILIGGLCWYLCWERLA